MHCCGFDITTMVLFLLIRRNSRLSLLVYDSIPYKKVTNKNSGGIRWILRYFQSLLPPDHVKTATIKLVKKTNGGCRSQNGLGRCCGVVRKLNAWPNMSLEGNMIRLRSFPKQMISGHTKPGTPIRRHVPLSIFPLDVAFTPLRYHKYRCRRHVRRLTT